MSSVLQLARGAALGGLIGVVVLAAALLSGLTTGTSIALYPLAAATGVAYGFIPNRSARLQAVGSAAFGVVALILGLATGFGALEVSGIIGAAAATVILLRDLSWRDRIPVPALGLIALLVVVASLVPLTLDGGGLGHDESAYALKARHWIEGTPETGWSIHRGVAMSAYGYLVFEAGGGDGQLRLLGLAAIVGFAAATWMLGSRIGGRWVGPLSAIALVSSPYLLRRSTEYLSDVPSSALLVACMVIVWKQFGERERPGYGLLWVLPFAWAAFYLRYQSALSLALVAVTLVVLFREKVKRGWRPIALTAGLGVIGLVPHFLYAGSEEGSPLGILLFTADVAGREFFGEGLVDYVGLMAWPLAAYVGPVAAAFFIWWLIARRGAVSDRIRCLFVMIPAVSQVLILGVLSHGEARFIFYPLALTLIGGVTGVTVVARDWRTTTREAVSLGLVVLLIGSLAMSVAYVRGAVESRADATELIQMAAEEARSKSDGESCGVMTSYFPQVTYFSGCYTTFFRDHLEPQEVLSRLEGEQRFLLVVEDGKNQPEGEDLDGIVDLTTGTAVRVVDDDDHADIYRFAP